MFLAQHLLISPNISLNAANLSVRHGSFRVLASSKDIGLYENNIHTEKSSQF